jgi:hypothetical protein
MGVDGYDPDWLRIVDGVVREREGRLGRHCRASSGGTLGRA